MFECVPNFAAFLKRQVRYDETAYAGVEGALCEGLKTESEQWIEVGHENDRCFDFAPDRFELVENPFQRDTFLDRNKTGPLNRHAVCHRVGKRNADFNYVSNFSYCT